MVKRMNNKALPSFSKGLFSGVILDDLIFPYPQINAEESENLKMIQDSFRKFARDRINATEFDAQAQIPEPVLQGLKELGFFGMNIPTEYDGFGLSNTAYVKMLDLITGIEGGTAITIGAHQSIGLKALLMFGSEEQKKRYLPDLVSGKMIAAFCLTESGAGSDAAGIKTRAVRDEKAGCYILNGSKLWITNGGIADFFTVFAKETITGNDGSAEDKISAFIVTRDMPGVSTGKEEKKLGIKSSSTTALFFENVRVPFDNLLGERGKGFKVAMQVLNSGRLGLAGGALGGLKVVFEEALQHVARRRQFGKTLDQFELIQKKIAQITIDLYAAESMVYLTTDLIDRGDVDYSLESAMCKIRSTEVAWAGVNECLQMVGGLGYMKEYPYERALRDARISTIFEGTNEILRLFIALSGMQERGEYLKKIGNALKGPIKGFGLLTEYATQWVKDRVSAERIRDVHAALAAPKVQFETWARNLHFSAERALVHHGRDIIYREMILERLAESAIDLFAMIATMARVDRCIQEQGAEQCANEIKICTVFCDQAWRRVRRNLLMVDSNNDKSLQDIAGYVVKEQKYPFLTF